MFDSNDSSEINNVENKDCKHKNDKASDFSKIAAGLSATNTTQTMVQQATKTFAKPSTFTGNRSLFDSGVAKVNAKKTAFGSGNPVVDPYTGDRLVLTKREARMLYGDDWTKHLAESDHIIPLEKRFDQTKKNPWLTTDDIKNTSNSKDNLEVVSRKYNNAKRSRTNEEFVTDEEYLKKTGVNLSEEQKANAIERQKKAQKNLNKSDFKNSAKNIAKTGHKAGMAGAQSAGVSALTVSGIMNMVSVIKGEKNSEEAIKDTIKDGGKAAVTGYAMTGGLTVATHSLSTSSSKFVKGLASSNVPGKVITAVLVTGDTIKKWGYGEITTQECIIELGEKGLNVATAGYSMAIGQALIPIPIVGGAIGALVGSVLTSNYYNSLINDLKNKQLEHQERMRIIEECNKAAEQTKKFRSELEEYLEAYFKEYRECFDDALSTMRFAYKSGDADGVITSANEITNKLGGKVYYNTVEEFKGFLDSEEVDEF